MKTSRHTLTFDEVVALAKRDFAETGEVSIRIEPEGANTGQHITLSDHFKGDIGKLDTAYINRNKLLSYRLISLDKTEREAAKASRRAAIINGGNTNFHSFVKAHGLSPDAACDFDDFIFCTGLDWHQEMTAYEDQWKEWKKNHPEKPNEREPAP